MAKWLLAASDIVREVMSYDPSFSFMGGGVRDVVLLAAEHSKDRKSLASPVVETKKLVIEALAGLNYDPLNQERFQSLALSTMEVELLVSEIDDLVFDLFRPFWEDVLVPDRSYNRLYITWYGNDLMVVTK